MSNSSLSSLSAATGGAASSLIISKFEAKSSRVKGLAFHPTLPWLLAAHHNGSLQIYDYRLGMVIDKYEEHSGPVRSCAFHPTQPLFASGGDDGYVRVFNYRQRKLLFSLSGHLDYVRSVAFHHEAPWIVSASDDQTCRIWNWQSRQCVAVLSGHNHYVMCAAFHVSEDLLVSGSLDQTIRVWDLSAIRAKNAPSQAGTLNALRNHSGSTSSATGSGHGGSPAQIELFAGSGLDTSVKFILEGHERGVNWVQFHPSRPLILSGSDDRSMKIWRFNDVRAWEVESYRGHSGNVSAVLWHPRADLALSDSEDRSLRVWDVSSISGGSSTSSSTSRSAGPRCIVTLKKENDRFWCLAVHPELNIFAAGHDSGLSVFKLERERPAYTLTEGGADGDCLFYVRDRLVRSFLLDGEDASDQFVAPLADALGSSLRLPASISYSPTERALLVGSNAALDARGCAILLREKGAAPVLFTGAFAIFVGRNRFVTLQPGPVILLQSLLPSEPSKPLPAPSEAGSITRLLPGPMGTFLACSTTAVFLLDGNTGRVLARCDAPAIKYAVWAPNYAHLALLGKKAVYLTDKSLHRPTNHPEASGVKSGAWDLSGPGPIFYYTTSFHLKYLLPDCGDSGIICTTSTPLYLIRVRGDLVHVLDRAGSVLVLAIDPTECHFKLALHSHDTARVNHLIANSNLVGQAIIAYLREKGHAAIALQFVKDPASRFELALECGDFPLAQEAALKIDSPAVWNRLAEEALQVGKVELARSSWMKANNSARLAFTDLLLGVHDASASSDLLHSALNPDSLNFAALLRHPSKCNLPVLAHLIDEQGGQIPSSADFGNFMSRHSLAAPAVRFIGKSLDWPLLFDPAPPTTTTITASASVSPPIAMKDGWGDADAIDALTEDFNDFTTDSAPAIDQFGDLDIPLDEDDLALLASETTAHASDLFDLELPAELPAPLAIPHHFQLHDFATLAEEVAALNHLAQLTPIMVEALQASLVSKHYLMPSNVGTRPLAPLPYNFDLKEREALETAIVSTTQGLFPEALTHFRRFLQLAAVSPTQADRADLDTARNYAIALMVEARRKESLDSSPAAALDLAILFTRVPMNQEHHLLSLRAALSLAYKLSALRTAAHLARRILALPAIPDTVSLQARKVLALAEKSNYTEALEGIRYGNSGSDDEPWIVDPRSLARIDPGATAYNCSYCLAKYASIGPDPICVVCQIGKIH